MPCTVSCRQDLCGSSSSGTAQQPHTTCWLLPGCCQQTLLSVSQLALPSLLPFWLLVTSLQSVDSCHLSFPLAPPLGSLSCISSDPENRLCQITRELLLSPVCNYNHDLGSVALQHRYALSVIPKKNPS